MLSKKTINLVQNQSLHPTIIILTIFQPLPIFQHPYSYIHDKEAAKVEQGSPYSIEASENTNVICAWYYSVLGVPCPIKDNSAPKPRGNFGSGF